MKRASAASEILLRRFPKFILMLSLLAGAAHAALAQQGGATARAPGSGQTSSRAPLSIEPGNGVVFLSASFASEASSVRSGLVWRVFNERAEIDGSHAVAAESKEATPALTLPDGTYIVHVAYGLAGATRRIVIAGSSSSERLTLNAGALQIAGTLGDAPIPPDRLSISIFVPERGNSEAKLVLSNARPGDVIGLPEGNYHIVSTYLDTVGSGAIESGGTSTTQTNSVVAADIRVPAGKIVTATLRHRAALLTLKLVNQPGGEALANTNFTILTPGGDVIRELIGAFPSLVLAEGEYVAIARNNGRTFQSNFKVASAVNRDVEVIAK